jgi:chemotaxis signal transduction protein
VSGVGELPDPTAEADSELLTGALLDNGDLVGVLDVPKIFQTLERAR